jgi:hypothetical protein
MEKEIVMYVLAYREINIDDDPLWAERIKSWTHHYSVPTIIIAQPGQDVPFETFLPRPTHRTIKGYDRGPMITEPNNQQLEDWLHKHGFLAKPYRR